MLNPQPYLCLEDLENTRTEARANLQYGTGQNLSCRLLMSGWQ